MRSATKLRGGSYWASWADSLEMVQKKHPDIADRFVSCLHEAGGHTECLEMVGECGLQLLALGMEVPSWASLAEGARPGKTPVEEQEPCFFKYGWQHVASKIVDDTRRIALFDALNPDDQAHLRSQSGPGAGVVLTAIPTSKELQIEPHLYRTIMLRRLRQLLFITCSICSCHRIIDP